MLNPILLSTVLVLSAAVAQATPPPPPASPVARQATATVKVKIYNVDRTGLAVSSDLCEVTGPVPVYETSEYRVIYPVNVSGCKAVIAGQTVDVFVGGSMEVNSLKPLEKAASLFVQATLPDEPAACQFCSPIPAVVSEGTAHVVGSNVESITLQAQRGSRHRLSKRAKGVWLEATATFSDK